MRASTVVFAALLSGCSNSSLSHHHLEPELWEEAANSSERACSGVAMDDSGPFGGAVSLTFDDGPHPVHTPAILEVLRERQIPATFFVLGKQLETEAGWALAQEIQADPLFKLASHSYNHNDMRRLSAADFDNEVVSTMERIRDLGTDGGFFRFPYGASTCDLYAQVTDHGYKVAGWHVDSADWCYSTGTVGTCSQSTFSSVPVEYENDMQGYVMSQVRRHNGGVLLFHDVHAGTAAALPGILDQLENEGYHHVDLDDSSVFPLLNREPGTELPWLGEACSTSDDNCGLAHDGAWCEALSEGSEAGVCTVDCQGFCSDAPGAATTFCATTPSGGGLCLAKSVEENAHCDEVPGSSEIIAQRFVGSSSASESEALICAPSDWPSE